MAHLKLWLFPIFLAICGFHSKRTAPTWRPRMNQANFWYPVLMWTVFQWGRSASTGTNGSQKGQINSQINGKAEYPWREGNALYLVGSEGCAVLWAAKTGWNHPWRTLPNIIDPFEESNSRKTPGICDQTRGNNFPSLQCSAPCCFSG